MKNDFLQEFLRFSFFVFFSLMTIGLNCYSDEQKDNGITSYEGSFNILRNADILYMNSEEQTAAFFTLLENENAINIFVELLRETKTGAGKFYALLGLFECNKNLYYEIIESVDLSINVRISPMPSADFSTTDTLNRLKIVIENGRWMRNFEENNKLLKTEKVISITPLELIEGLTLNEQQTLDYYKKFRIQMTGVIIDIAREGGDTRYDESGNLIYNIPETSIIIFGDVGWEIYYCFDRIVDGDLYIGDTVTIQGNLELAGWVLELIDGSESIIESEERYRDFIYISIENCVIIEVKEQRGDSLNNEAKCKEIE
jgi:hypothetical protein